MATRRRLKAYLDSQSKRFEGPEFIQDDPVSIVHGFDNPRDQEIIGLFAALLAWGRRQTVLDKLHELCERMEFRPDRFVRESSHAHIAESMRGFKHRTFNERDAYWLIRNLRYVLDGSPSLEARFAAGLPAPGLPCERQHLASAIQALSNAILAAHDDTPPRLAKHLPRPATGSACKRFNMYLRWMVRPGPFDLGIWSCVRRSDLLMPLDVHTGRQARRLGLLQRSTNDWRATVELTDNCRSIDPEDPVRYDFALFGSGAYGVEPPAQLVTDS